MISTGHVHCVYYLERFLELKKPDKIMVKYIKNSYDESSSDSNRLSPSSLSVKRMKKDETEPNFTRETYDTFWGCFNEMSWSEKTKSNC